MSDCPQIVLTVPVAPLATVSVPTPISLQLCNAAGGTTYGIIYKITNRINGKVYIGQTISGLNERKRSHRKALKRKNRYKSYLYDSINHHGWDSFDWEIIDAAVSIEQLNEKESYWIEFYKATNRDYGYNSRSGGGRNHRMNDETRAKISKSIKENYTTEEIANRQIGRVRSKETRDYLSQIAKERYANGFLNQAKQNPDTPKDPISGKFVAVKIQCVETGKIYNSILAAANEYGVGGGCLSMLLNGKGKRKTVAGLHWIKVKDNSESEGI